MCKGTEAQESLAVWESGCHSEMANGGRREEHSRGTERAEVRDGQTVLSVELDSRLDLRTSRS